MSSRTVKRIISRITQEMRDCASEARLAASAPALRDALEELINAVRDYDRFGGEDDLAERDRIIDDAVNLIASCGKGSQCR